MSYVQSNSVVNITGAITLTAADSGKIFLVANPSLSASDFDISLPTPTAGTVFMFIAMNGAATTGSYSVLSTAANINLFGQVNNAVGTQDGVRTITNGGGGADSAPSVGDMIILRGTSSNYSGLAFGGNAGSMLFA